MALTKINDTVLDIDAITDDDAPAGADVLWSAEKITAVASSGGGASSGLGYTATTGTETSMTTNRGYIVSDGNLHKFTFPTTCAVGDLVGIKGNNGTSLATGVWSIGNSIPLGVQNVTGFGVQNASMLMAGGEQVKSDRTFYYDGSVWSDTPNLNTAKEHSHSFGNTSSGVHGGGTTAVLGQTSDHEKWNGSTWSVVNSSTRDTQGSRGCGTSDAGLICCGYDNGNYLTTTEHFDGVSFSDGGSTSTSRNYSAVAGTQSAAIITQGAYGGGGQVTNTSEEYNGIAWTTGNNNNYSGQQGSISGTQSDAVMGSFYSFSTGGVVDNSQVYNGSVWSIGLSLPQGTYGGHGTGSSIGMLHFGGKQAGSGGSGFYQGTQIYESHVEGVIGTWSTGGTPTYSISTGSSTGLQSAAISAGGGYSKNCSTYDGTSWTAESNLAGAGKSYLGMGGSVSDAVTSGGWTGSNSNQSEKWNGSSWSLGNVYPVTCRGTGVSGTSQASTLSTGGYTTGPITNTYEYSGSSWGSGGSLPAGNNTIRTSGTSTSAIGVGDNDGNRTGSYTYDGSSWSTIADTNVWKSGHMVAGDVSSALAATGYNTGGSGNTPITETYNGTSWSIGQSNPSGMAYACRAGSASNAMFAFGSVCVHYDVGNWIASLTDDSVRKSTNIADSKEFVCVVANTTWKQL